MQHSFEVEDAVKYGIEKAIILNNLRFWLEKNRANRKNISDGQVWTYNSAEAFELLFPYMKARTIARYLRELEFDGVIISGVNSDNKLDRTKWYSTPDYSITKCDVPSSQNGESAESEFAYSNLTICDNVTDINKQIVNTDIKQESKDLVPSVKNASTPVSNEQLFEVSLLLKNGEKFNPTINQVRSWVETYKNANVHSELAIMAEWCTANPAKRKTKAGILRFCNSWLSRADKQKSSIRQTGFTASDKPSCTVGKI